MEETKPYVHYFEGRLSIEPINNLISILHDKEKAELWIDTFGGDICATLMLLSFLNSRHKDINIVLTNSVASAGIFFLLDFKGNIRVENLHYAMFHVIDRERYPLRKSDYISDDILQKQDAQSNIILAEKIKNKGLLNDKQLKQFLRGKDVIIYADTINKWKL